MKKLALILGLLSLFLSATTPIDAICTPMGISCPADKVQCSGRETDKCCDSPDDCVASQVKPNQAVEPEIKGLCKFAGEKSRECMICFGRGEAWTAIGCIPTDPAGFIGKFLNLGIGIAGGIAFLLILFSGFQMMTSAGNPEKLNAGKELLTSAISGLVLIIFSIFLLRLIGVDILGLPEFK